MAQRANSVASNTPPLSPIEERVDSYDGNEADISNQEGYTYNEELVAALIAATQRLVIASAPIAGSAVQPMIRSAASVDSTADPSAAVAPPTVIDDAAIPTAVPPGKLYAANYAPPSKPPNAVAPPAHLVTPPYGYHVPVGNTSGKPYVIIRGLNIGIFDDWGQVASLTLHVKGNVQYKVKTIEEAHRIMRSAIDDGSALYLS